MGCIQTYVVNMIWGISCSSVKSRAMVANKVESGDSSLQDEIDPAKRKYPNLRTAFSVTYPLQLTLYTLSFTSPTHSALMLHLAVCTNW